MPPDTKIVVSEAIFTDEPERWDALVFAARRCGINLGTIPANLVDATLPPEFQYMVIRRIANVQPNMVTWRVKRPGQ